MPDEAFDQEDPKMILISAQDCLRRDRKADLNLEFSIGSVADMANVAAIVLETHLRQMQSVAEAPLAAEQALKHLESGTEALSFAIYHLKGMIKDLNSISKLLDQLVSEPAGSRRVFFE